MTRVNNLMKKIEKLLMHIKRFFLIRILKNMKNIKKNNTEKKINIIKNDQLDFKHCFSDLIKNYFNDEEEKKENQKLNKTKRKSVMVGTSEQILKNNLKSKVKEFNSNIKNKNLKLTNINQRKKPLILEPYQNIINSMKKTQRKSCVINSFSFNNKKNEKKNSNNFQQYKRSKTVIKYYKPKIPFFLNQIKKKNKRKKTWNTNSISLLKTNPIQEVDSSFENNNQSISSINKSSFQNSNIENSKEKKLKNETIDLNFDMEIENSPNNIIINNNNDPFDPKIILLILLLKKDITFKIKTFVFNLIKKYSRKMSIIEDNFDTIQDNFNEINKDRFENISIIYKKAFKLIKKNT